MVWTVGAALKGWLPLGLGCVLNTVLCYLAFTPMHDAVHGAISGGRRGFRWLDSLVGWSCALLFFAPYVAFRRLHLRHHAATNDPRRDPDYWVVGSGPGAIALRCLSVIPHYYRFFLATGGFGGSKYNGERSQAIVAIGGLIAVFWLFVSGGYGEQVVFLWLVPALLASGLLALTFDWLPHQPHRKRSRYKNTRLLTGWGLHWLLVAQDLHLVHHLYPKVPFYRYRRLYHRLKPLLERERVKRGRLWPGGT